MLRQIANAFNCEMEIELYHYTYLMRVNLGVISKFTSETGADLQQLGIKALRAYDDSKQAPTFWAQQELLINSVTLDHAAHLFYLAAHECNSKVEFEEIQDALLHMALQKADEDAEDVLPSYPVLFIQLMTLVLCGPSDDIKKNLSESEPSPDS